MKQTVLLILTTLFSLPAFSQQEAAIVGYFDLAWQRTDKAKAAYYRTVEPAGDRFIVKDYYKSGQLQMQALCTAYEPTLIWSGVTKLYYENGTVKEEGMFENEGRIGLHKYWYDDGKIKKEVIHNGEKDVMAQFWSSSGEPMLVNGNGIVSELELQPTFREVKDSIIVSSFDVRNGTDTVFTTLAQQAEYKGGMGALQRDLLSTMKYPKKARRMGTEGRVFVGFVVDKRGMATNPQVLKGISAECDAESLRVVSTLNHWSPGRWRGKPVAVRFVLPINFKLR